MAGAAELEVKRLAEKFGVSEGRIIVEKDDAAIKGLGEGHWNEAAHVNRREQHDPPAANVLHQAGATYLGSWAGSIAGAELGFVVGEIPVPIGGGSPERLSAWAVGGAAGSGAAAPGAGFLYDAVVPGGDCAVPPASGHASRSKSSS